MAAGSDLTSKSIAPGSTEYGERQSLEQGLAAGMGGGGLAGAPAPPSTTSFNATNPLGALTQGRVKGRDLPLTDGLSVGPGASPMMGASPMHSTRAERLRAVATQAATPALRAMARAALRRMSREGL